MTHYLILLAKQPRAGFSKTRLAADIGDAAAADLAEAMLLDSIESARATGAEVLLAHAPEDAGPWFEERAPWAQRWPQPDLPFGQRMRTAFVEARRRGATSCVMIGMDTPQVPVETLLAAFAALEASDLCVGPATDGGYYLIGTRSDHPELFEGIPWSTGEVLGATLAACAKASLTVEQLREESDVDDLASLDGLRRVLPLRPGVAPRTRLLLEQLGGRPQSPGA